MSIVVIEINQSLLAGYRCADDEACVNPPENRVSKGTKANLNSDINDRGDYSNSVSNMSLSSDIRTQVRSLLAARLYHQYRTCRCNRRRRLKLESWLTEGTDSKARNEGACR